VQHVAVEEGDAAGLQLHRPAALALERIAERLVG
jgi:hypothetical protein